MASSTQKRLALKTLTTPVDVQHFQDWFTEVTHFVQKLLAFWSRTESITSLCDTLQYRAWQPQCLITHTDFGTKSSWIRIN